MVDRIDPTNQTSVEYGQSLLDRKIAQEEKFAKEARKDNRINYAFQVLGGVDDLIKDRARRNVMEQNNQLTQDIIREEAEFNKLQKEFEDQAPWRASNDPYGYATQLAKGDLADVWGQRLAAGASPLSEDEKTEYQNSVKALADNYYNKYQENKISALPFETKEEYTADLRAQLNKEAPSGLLDIALRGLGFRGNKQEELKTKISNVRTTYEDRLRDRPNVKGSVDNLSEEAKLALIQVPKQDLTPTRKRVQINTKGTARDVIEIQDKVTGEFTFTDLFGEPLSKTDLGMQPSKSYTTNAANDIALKYQKDFGPSQIATIHSAIATPNNPHYNLEIADALKFHGLFEYTFNVDAKATVLNKQFDDEMSKTVEPFKDEKVLEKQTAAKIPEALAYQLSQTSSDQNYNIFKTRVVEDALKIQREGVRDSQGILQPVKEMHAYDASFLYHSQRIKPVTRGAGWFDGKKRTVYEFTYEEMPSGIFDSPQAPPVNRAEDGKPDSTEQVNRDTDELIKSEEFQTKSPTEQKQILQNAADQGADINPDLLRPDGTQKDTTGFLGPIKNNVTGKIMSEVTMGVGPEGSQKLIPILVPTLTNEEIEILQNMELEGNVANIPQSIKDKAVRHAQEREEKGLSPFYGGGNLGERPEGVQLELTGDESIPTQDLQNFVNEEKEMLSSSRQQTPIDLSTLTEEELEEYSRTGGEEALSQSNFFSRQQTKQRLTTLERYADGILNKNRKPSPNSSVGKALRAFNLENMSRSEIKEWLKENTLDTLAPKQ